MSSTITQTSFEANLASLGDSNADLAARLRSVASTASPTASPPASSLASPPASPPATSAAALVYEESAQGVLTARGEHGWLASRHRPLDEADGLAATVDVLENAVAVVLGFGLGYHVQALAKRFKGSGVIVVFEPDLALLRSVFDHVDHSAWMKDALLVFVTDPTDRGQLARKLEGAEAIIAQGIALVEHPASRRRLGDQGNRFSSMLAEFVTGVKTKLVTTLVRSVDSVRNLLLNIDHYAGGPGIADLAGAATGRLGVIVSAGPSLRRNVHLLAQPGVRDRCVIIAVQTTLKPLLAAGVRPHFVTALDYHEISRRFYEGLTADDVAGITLVVDPKAHPAIIDAFPGAVRCCAAPFLDKLLGPEKREMGVIQAGATVAHLAVYLARHLGCNPIAMIGQDLGFTDGLYYAPGTAIHDVWAPELNPFNTLAMMEWQRIARHRSHLHRTVDIRGRAIYTDAQMLTYLQQFERDFAVFAEEGIEMIDATEGGVAKQHTTARPLAEVLHRCDVLTVHAPLTPSLSLAPPTPAIDTPRLAAAETRLALVQRQMEELRDLSRKTAPLLRRLREDQADPVLAAKHFRRIERCRKQVEERMEAFDLLNAMNQLGAYKRLRSDRRLHMQRTLDPMERQRAQLDRDLVNVVWLADAADEMVVQLDAARHVLRRESAPARSAKAGVATRDASPALAAAGNASKQGDQAAPRTATRVAALVAVDPERNGLGEERSLSETLNGVGVLQLTLERLGRTARIESIVLIAPRNLDLDALIDRARIGRPVEIERTPASPFGPEQAAVAAARRWAHSCWRGGVGGMSIWDEAICPSAMHAIMRERHIDAAVVVAPDWPCVDISAETGVDAQIDRFLEHPDHHRIVFTQAPPGLGACVISAATMEMLARRGGPATIGGFLVYDPAAPRGDLIATDANVQIDHAVRHSLVRATFDSPRQARLLRRALASGEADLDRPETIVRAIERVEPELDEASPRHVIIELTADRASTGFLRRRAVAGAGGDRPPLTRELAARIFEPLGVAGEAIVTFAGAGDPLRHDQFDEIIRIAIDAGLAHVHVRTELLAAPDVIDRLLAVGPEIVSVDLHANSAAAYARAMGIDAYDAVCRNIAMLAERRHPLAGVRGRGLALPWIVPRLERRLETYEEVDGFFDRWQHAVGAVLIDAPPPGAADLLADDDLTPAVTPAHVLRRERRQTMAIRCDGAVPFETGSTLAGCVATTPVLEIWRRIRRSDRPDPNDADVRSTAECGTASP